MTGRRALAALLLFTTVSLILPAGAGALGFEALTVGLSEAWTGNGTTTTASGEAITGSETTPIDPYLRLGARIGLLDGLLASGAVVAVEPRLEFGARRYLLLEDGRVVPTQIETATGGAGQTLQLGSARVVTLRLPLPVAYELRFLERHAAFMSISPTFVFRIVAGEEARREDVTSLAGMYSYFYGAGRFVMPELALGYRFGVSDFVEATVRATWGVSVADVLDPVTPWWHENRIAITVDMGFRPPFGGALRERERTLPEGVEPFPGD
ncbi:MAG: hypothetical protein ACOC1U_06375 [Spirochaetota bacterium]